MYVNVNYFDITTYNITLILLCSCTTFEDMELMGINVDMAASPRLA